jgi:hypothetical protein
MSDNRQAFAGFPVPRKLARWKPLNRSARGPRRAKDSPWCFAYRITPPEAGKAEGASFYHESEFMPGLRWQWCDKVEGIRIRHEGWFMSPDGDGDTIRGIVFRLPRSRGFLAGWSMGKGMAGRVLREVFATERQAAYAADREAESVAEAEREREEYWRAGQEAGEAWREGMAESSAAIATARRARQEARDAARLALALRGAAEVPPDILAGALAGYRASLKAAREALAGCCEARREAWRRFRNAVPDYDRDARAAFMEGAGL